MLKLKQGWQVEQFTFAQFLYAPDVEPSMSNWHAVVYNDRKAIASASGVGRMEWLDSAEQAHEWLLANESESPWEVCDESK